MMPACRTRSQCCQRSKRKAKAQETKAIKVKLTLLAALSGLFVASAVAATPNDGSVLPFPTPPSASKAGQTLQESVHKRRVEPKHLSKDAPNILIIFIDDAGFGTPDTFGGFAHTPTLTKLRDEGVSYNRFHTTSICSPTRRHCSPGAITSAWAAAQSLSGQWIGTVTRELFRKLLHRLPRC